MTAQITRQTLATYDYTAVCPPVSCSQLLCGLHPTGHAQLACSVVDRSDDAHVLRDGVSRSSLALRRTTQAPRRWRCCLHGRD
jgi:hypothetical protein